MNERIRELADESAKYSAIMALPTGQSGNELFVEKFAELTVKDCISTLRSNGYDDAAKCLQDIHFGIENPV
jgi:hypothetical protein